MLRFVLFFLVSMIICLPTSLSAQNTTPLAKKITFRSFFGYSGNSARFLGKTENAKSTIIGIGIKKFLKQKDGVNIYYTADLIPYLNFDYPKKDSEFQQTQVSGFAISPLGFILEQPVNNLFNLQLGSSAAFVWMEEVFPTDNAKQLNFTFDISPAFEANLSPQFSLVGGYKFHHISNAQTGSQNPGVDSNFFFFSIHIK